MVGRVVDRGAPHAAHAEIAGQRHEPARGARASARMRPSRSSVPRRAARRGRSSRTGARPPRAASTARRRCRTPSACARRRRPRGPRAPRPSGAPRRPGCAGRPAGRPRAATGRRSAAPVRSRSGRRRSRPRRPGDPSSAEPAERRPLAQLDARRLHRERVRPDVPRRVDGAVGREIAARRDDRSVRASGRRSTASSRRQPADVEPLARCIATRSRPARSSSSVTARIR